MAILLLLGGLFFQDNVIMWLAATSELYAVIRGALIAVLLSLLFTHPPRSMAFRTFFGVVSVASSGLTLSFTYMNMMNFLDSLLFLAAGVLFALAALEPKYSDAPKQIEVEDVNQGRTDQIPVHMH